MAEAIYIVGNQSIIDIADAIREKNPDVTGGITVADMPQKIRDIPTGGGGELPYTRQELPIHHEPVIIHVTDYEDTYFYCEVNYTDTETGDSDIDLVLIHPSDNRKASNYFDVSVSWGDGDYTVTLTPKWDTTVFNEMTVEEFTMNPYMGQVERNFFFLLSALHY